ncbi:MAG: hypothetical protein R2710_11680 [Acidimicrobiales bacterium]
MPFALVRRATTTLPTASASSGIGTNWLARTPAQPGLGSDRSVKIQEVRTAGLGDESGNEGRSTVQRGVDDEQLAELLDRSTGERRHRGSDGAGGDTGGGGSGPERSSGGCSLECGADHGGLVSVVL